MAPFRGRGGRTSRGGRGGRGEEAEEVKPVVKAYSQLLQSFHQDADPGERKAKRRKIEAEVPVVVDEEQEVQDALGEEEEEEDQDEEAVENGTEELHSATDPFEIHFANPDDNELSQKLKAIQGNDWKVEKSPIETYASKSTSIPSCAKHDMSQKKRIKNLSDLALKERLARNLKATGATFLSSELEQSIAVHVFDYQDVLLGDRTISNAAALRSMASAHAVNHILKGRDKLVKNNERLNHADDATELDVRDQGYVRPKVLILLETRQMAANYAEAIIEAFQPEQQENKKRFVDSFTAPLDDRETMPEDYRELFGGNNDNSFLTALKFTRKTLKFYSAFYNSDVILASPLGLRRIIENEDSKKRDHDFLSSIEVCIVDQADAMQMQDWTNVEVVFNHLNLELKETHGCDFSRVRNWYLDGNAKYLRQTILFSVYLTPEMNRLYNTSMLNIAGKAKITPTYPGDINDTSGLGIKQTFLRFDSPSPPSDPDARFKFFTTAILPSLLCLPKSADNAQGILIFIPSYFDFLRLRNFFATSTQTQDISFGAIHDYSDVSSQRRARSHFVSGRHSFLLYTQRAHHFFRLKLKGVKRVVLYGVPDNPVFYRELVEGFLGTSVNEGKVDPVEAGVRAVFSRWDGLRMERVVGSARVKGMLGGVGDTFDFV
ncbi:hypothetical protein M409DRAFT_70831 [Zasmidium cellare ATCC 36951]|uniref:U3 small nucleolar RNA-associated protein 25 n=1 Tax=Zasmidium cellare ATCC 36951 TaxID=1080233 RepID=A0A6A6BYB1_ZASCE|nr:uncharacterized protein M409DRAFT_70831 [Zasmidium cellare ATCC 36951]KAF2159794.1 hypothetical protein M409DRAFT_70831 [Zasmidium cellare ATCC 36951]